MAEGRWTPVRPRVVQVPEGVNIGRLIGKGGKNFREIGETTGTKVFYKKESNNIQVTLYSQGNIDAAVEKLQKLIDECTPLILNEISLKDKVIELFRRDNCSENICRRTGCRISLNPKVESGKVLFTIYSTGDNADFKTCKRECKIIFAIAGNDKHPAFLDCRLSPLTRIPESAIAEVAKTEVKVNYGSRRERQMTQCHYLTLANRPRDFRMAALDEHGFGRLRDSMAAVLHGVAIVEKERKHCRIDIGVRFGKIMWKKLSEEVPHFIPVKSLVEHDLNLDSTKPFAEKYKLRFPSAEDADFSHLKLVSSPTCLSVGLVIIDGSKDLNYRSALLKCVKNGDRFTMAEIMMTKKILYYDGLCLDCNYDVCLHMVKHDHFYDDEELFLKAIGEKVASSIQERKNGQDNVVEVEMITRDSQYVVYFVRRYEKKMYEYPFNGCSFLLSHSCKEFRSQEKRMESGEIPKNGTPVEVELFEQDGELELLNPQWIAEFSQFQGISVKDVFANYACDSLADKVVPKIPNVEGVLYELKNFMNCAVKIASETKSVVK